MVRSNLLTAAVLAASLNACTAVVSPYESIERIITHPQNYVGCEIAVRGIPTVLSRSMPGGGKMHMVVGITTDDGKELRFSETLDRKLADELFMAFSRHKKYTFQGMYRESGFDVRYIRGRDREYSLPADI